MIRSVGGTRPSAIVVDASVVADALLATDDRGEWAEAMISTHPLVAPHLILAEVAQVLRRLVARGRLAATDADAAHATLVQLPIQLFGYEPFARRIWELRDDTTPYDAWYVALAEGLDLPLATADRRLARAPRARCRFVMPPRCTAGTPGTRHGLCSWR